jgi:phosphodiesterase/alkaline phosphatase D-like protein
MALRGEGRRLGGAALAAAAAWLALAGSAVAAAPTAITGAVTGFGTTSATVSGTVNPNGSPTTWHFEYGRDAKYGSMTPAENAGSATTAANVSATIDGLSPKTTYHYRFVAANASGTTDGADGLFATAAAQPPDVVTGAATGVSGTSATLNGTVDPNGRPATWYFEYGTTTGYGSRTPARDGGSGTSATPVSAPVGGLTPGGVYHVRLVATGDAGTTLGSDQTFSLGAAPAATTSSAVAVSSSSATLRGTVDPNAEDTSWRFEYGTSSSYGSATQSNRSAGGTKNVSVTAAVAGLAAGTTYHFRVVATNASGTSGGGDRTFTTRAGAAAATTGPAQGVGATNATLTGTVDPAGRSTSWYFEYGTSAGYGSRTASRSVSGSGARAISAGVSGLAPGATYHFRLVASSSAGTTRGADGSFQTAGAAVTIRRPAPLVTYGRAVTLSGSIVGGQSGVPVEVQAQPFAESSFRSIATVRTGAGGTWTYTARPTIRTAYQASANGATSARVAVAVRPAVSLRVSGGARLSTHVGGRGSFAGRVVQLQRRSGSRWVTVRRAQLNARSSATFSVRALPHGRSTIRIAMSVNEAGAGYLAGFSRTLSSDRR